MPPKRRKQVLGDPKSFRGEFSFVNKDASNIDSKDHNAAVSWHVMNRYERWKRKEQARKLRASANIPADPSSSSGAPTELDEEPVITTYPPSPWQMDNLEQTMLGSSELSPEQDWPHPSSFAEDFNDPSFASGVEGSTDVGALHQEDAPPGQAHYPPLVAQILSYAYGHVIPVTWPNEFGKAKWTYEISRTWDDIAAIKEDSCYASALLCFYATMMAAATNDRDLTSQACFFQVQAMTELRQRLATRPNQHDSLTLRAILKLFSAETALDNTAAARVHLKSLRSFVNASGGVFTLDPWFREDLLATDCYFALKYETRPLFPASEWSPGPISQPWKARLSQAGILEEHPLGIDAGIEHVNLRSIIGDLRELFRVEGYINTHEVPSDDQLLRWRQLRKLDCLNRLAEHQLSVRIYPHLYQRPKLQLATCAAMALMTGMVLGSPEPVRSGLKILTELRDKIGEAKAEIDKANDNGEKDVESSPRQLMLWLLYVGFLGEQTHPIRQQSIWFKSEFRAATTDLGLPSVDAQRNVARNFLYSSSLEEEIQNSRAQRGSESRKGVYELCGMSWRAPVEDAINAESTVEGGSSRAKGKRRER